MQPSVSTHQFAADVHRKPYGFSRKQRLLTGQEYKAVFAQGQRSGNPYWTVYVWQHGQPYAKLGLAIAKKTLRRAHERNRVKRLAREVFRHTQTQLQGISLVVMAGKAAESADKLCLATQLRKLLKRAISVSVTSPHLSADEVRSTPLKTPISHGSSSHRNTS